MTDPSALKPIEADVRAEEPPDDTVLVIRAGPLTVEKLVEHAQRQQREYSYRGLPMSSVSVDAAVAGWTVEAILRDRLWSRSSYSTGVVRVLRGAGFELLPTFEAPHYDVVLPTATTDAASTLLSLFGPAERNPYRRRR